MGCPNSWAGQGVPPAYSRRIEDMDIACTMATAYACKQLHACNWMHAIACMSYLYNSVAILAQAIPQSGRSDRPIPYSICVSLLCQGEVMTEETTEGTNNRR